MDDNQDDGKPRRNPSLTMEMGIQAQAARLLIDSLKRSYVIDEEDDPDLIRDTIEGETNLMETIQACLDRLDELDTHDKALKEQIEARQQRRRRFSHQIELLRLSIQEAMDIAQQERIEFPNATVTVRNSPPSVQVLDESEIPSQFWKKQDPLLDKRELLKALKDGPVAGATLSNPRKTIMIKRG